MSEYLIFQSTNVLKKYHLPFITMIFLFIKGKVKLIRMAFNPRVKFSKTI